VEIYSREFLQAIYSLNVLYTTSLLVTGQYIVWLI
jgi:hypothetical protein